MGSEPVPEPRVQPAIQPTHALPDRLPGLAGVAPAELASWLTARGQPSFRARQLADHVWSASAQSIAELLTGPLALRHELEADFRLNTLTETDLSAADQDLTQKALHRLGDGSLIESVLMRYPARGWRRAGPGTSRRSGSRCPQPSPRSASWRPTTRRCIRPPPWPSRC